MQHRRRLALTLSASVALMACSERALTSPADRAVSAHRAAVAASPTVVMSGLDSPRGLALAPDGSLYVVESGNATITGPCVPIARGSNCYSGTGAISRFRHGRQERVATGLPSVFNPGTNEVAGPHDISFQGRGNAFVSIGWGAAPNARAGLGALGAQFGLLIRVSPDGRWRAVADLADHEQANNPSGGPFDSNPYGVLAEPARRFVTDAGGNSLIEVRANGHVSTIATFPATVTPPGPFSVPFPTSEAVPTEVTRGPDGALYVSTLSGVPFLPGVARIYRVADGGAPTVFADGLTQITDFDWGPDGSLYVLQFASAPFLNGPGSVVRIAPSGVRTTVATGLTNPTGILVAADGVMYVSNRSNAPGVGEVLRVSP
jgi:hypothetical protein